MSKVTLPIKNQKEILLAQCSECNAVKIMWKDGRPRWQYSLAVFSHLPKELCFEHQLTHQHG